jgi:hypothetical protein
MEVGEEHLTFAEPRVLLGQRLLDLEDEVGLPDVRDSPDSRSDGLVVGIPEGAAHARTLLDQDGVPVAGELEGAGGRERDAVLVRLDLLGDADVHWGRGTIAI